MDNMKHSLNPLLDRNKLPSFGQIKPQHVIPAIRSVLAQQEKKLITAEKSTTGWELLDILNEIEYEIHRTWGPVTHLMGVQNTIDLREGYEVAQKEIIKFSLRMEQSIPVYQTLLALDKEKWSKAEQRVIKLRLLSVRFNGIGLKEERRKEFNKIVTELSQSSIEFSNNVLDATKAYALDLQSKDEIEGLPFFLLEIAAQSYNKVNQEKIEINLLPVATAEKGPWRITLDAPSYIPFLQHGRNRKLREKLYRAFVTKASSGKFDNTSLIQKILKLRKQQAHLLGYNNYAEMRIDTRMANNTKEVYGLMEDLRMAAWEPAMKELDELQKFAFSHGEKENLQLWDIAYWSERLREERFGFTEEELRSYFPLSRVLSGLFALVETIFNIEVTSADGDAPVWHPDVHYFHVLDEDKNQIASFYLDPYSRPEDKRGGAWMDECISRRKIGKEIELPIAYLVCNASPPIEGKPALMSFREVETLFHEFGHGLQHMLTRVNRPEISGINGVEWDAVELPSQFMENWCYHQPCLLSLSSHMETGATLPDELFEKIKKARTYMTGNQMLRQLRFSFVDMDLHSSFDPNLEAISFFDVQKKVDARTALIMPLPEDRTLCSFSHIFAGGYAAGYYSYKWAEVLSADAFSTFEEAGLENSVALKKIGLHFRETILALGGSESPAKIFLDFRGRKPSSKALLRHTGLVA